MAEIVNTQTDNVDYNLSPFNFKLNWEEYTGLSGQSQSSDSFAPDGSNCTLVGMVPYDDMYEALLNILGYHYTHKNGATYELKRVPPVQHPRFGWLFATRVMNGVGVGMPVKRGTPSKLKAFSAWEKERFTVQFESLPYRVQSHSKGLINEYDRYVSYEIEPGEEVLQAQTGQLLYAEGPQVNKPYPGTQSLIASKSFYLYTWHFVPLDWALNDSGVFVQSEAATGKVNTDEFLGHPAGTLLCRPPRVTRVPASIAPKAKADVPYYLNIQFRFQRFDPPSGIAVPTQRGHNLAPNQNDRKYYYATSDGTSGGRPIYESFDFKRLFKHHSATA